MVNQPHTIRGTDYIWGGVTYWDGHPARCNLFIAIKRKRKYAYLRIRRGNMEIAGETVAWVGDEPSLSTMRIRLADLEATLSNIQGI